MTSPGAPTPADETGTPPSPPEPAEPREPFKPRGPKRWGVEPDWSKLPSAPRRRPVVDDGPGWGASSFDARTATAAAEPQDAPEPAPAWQTPAFLADPGSTEPAAPEEELDEDDDESSTESTTSRPEAAMTTRPSGTSDTSTTTGTGGAEGHADRERTYDDPYADVPYFDEPAVDEPFDAPYDSPEPVPARSQDARAAGTREADGSGAAAATRSRHRVAVGPDDDLRGEAETALRRLVGRDDAVLRDDQWTAIDALVREQRRALVVQRTGWGKSAVYFVSTALLRARGAGPTIIVSPLLALMRDQIAAAERAGIRAATINSANVTEWDEIHGRIAAGEIDVLLCSPERLNNPGFRDEVLPRLAADAGLVVIDEAHCVSDWGHDFRPDYRRIRTLLADLPEGIPVLATTATANARVTQDVAEQLEIAGDDGRAEVLVLRGGLDRESLHLAVLRLKDQPTRVAWLMEALRSTEGSGIVYCLTVSVAEQVASQLKEAGIPVAAYTGRTDPTERESLEADLKDNRVKALIATSALGMGFDKPDLAFVVHMGAPSSPIAYYQQVGRAGRGVDDALVVLLPGEEDRRIWEYFGSLAFPREDQVRATLDALARGGTMSAPFLETQVDLTRSRLEMMLKVLDVDGAVKRVKGGWESTGRGWTYDAERYRRVEEARLAEQATMVGYVTTDRCRMAYLRATLDDPELGPDTRCGRCDNCGGVTLPAAPSADHVASARRAMDTPGVVVEPRKMWPSGMASLGVDLKGKIPEGSQHGAGRAVARLDGLGWSQPLRELFAPERADGEVPVALRKAAVQVLDAWPDGTGVDGVVALRSVTRPVLVMHLAQGLAKYLGKPFVGTVGPTPERPEPPRHDVNSAMRLAGVHQRLALELAPAALAGLAGRSILLVDDYVDSGWTLAVATVLLRDAGAARVLPLVLAQR